MEPTTNTTAPGPPACGPGDTAALRALAREFPNRDAAQAEIARRTGALTMPKGTVHVISDVHGDDVKLRHVINNASGTLRPLVERLFASRLTADELRQLLALLFYPRETLDELAAELDEPAWRAGFALRVMPLLFELVRTLSRRYSIEHATRLFPADYRALLIELVWSAGAEPLGGYTKSVIESLVRDGRGLHLLRLVVRLARNLAVDELVLAGDFWDRGPRGDRVVEYLRRQPRVSITWGNHDVAWLGACLGHSALVAHVLRISTRYRRLSQLEEGYGVMMEPLENLARRAYADDPAACYVPQGSGLRETVMMARMQKAAAVLQFKLEGQLIRRNPAWQLEHRMLLHRMDLQAGTVEIDGAVHTLADTHFPTIDSRDPYALSPDEVAALERVRQSFLSSAILWDQMRFLVEHGAMYLVRDDHLIFHACVPSDERGEFQELTVDGVPRKGRALFDAIGEVIVRVLDDRAPADLDLLWYLWCGPRSPLFGKDRIATFENDLVADPATHLETKNAYFRLIHEVPFCDRVLAEFGADASRGLIVNGHVPVRVEQGESPLKRSGKAITIDGAFSRAYGDHGYTLVLESDRTFLARHHHFESVRAAVHDGIDIIPTITAVREWKRPRLIGDTEQGAQIRADMSLLEQLVDAYRHNRLRGAEL
jgi:fructose-1,6-bisphosphatase-3